jgi:hypothetical protein
MTSMRLLCGAGLVLGLSVSFLPAEETPAVPSATQPAAAASEEAEYAKVAATRADDAVAAAKIADSAMAYHAKQAVGSFYVVLHLLHAERDAEIKSKNYDKKSDEAKKLTEETQAKAEARVVKLTDQLNAVATPEQVNAIKDKITYNVRPNTIAAYSDELPQLTDEQKQYIAGQLMEGREKALTGGTSNEKHAWFGKYKGRINIYLSKQGYDMKAESKAWAERLKQRRNGAATQPN